MSSLRSGPAGAGPVLVVRTRQSDHRLQAGTSCRVGRDPGSDIVLSDTRVSWRHAVLRYEQDTWILEDVGSTNGTFIGTQRVDRITISSECVIRLGNPEDGPVLRCEPAANPVHAPTEISAPAVGSRAMDGDRPGAVEVPPRPAAPHRGAPRPEAPRRDEPRHPEAPRRDEARRDGWPRPGGNGRGRPDGNGHGRPDGDGSPGASAPGPPAVAASTPAAAVAAGSSRATTG